MLSAGSLPSATRQRLALPIHTCNRRTASGVQYVPARQHEGLHGEAVPAVCLSWPGEVVGLETVGRGAAATCTGPACCPNPSPGPRCWRCPG